MRCPRCSKDVTDESRFCPTCGFSLEETMLADDAAPGGGGAPQTPQSPAPGAAGNVPPGSVGGHGPAVSSGMSSSSAAWISSSSSGEAGFAPGTMLVGRYRIVGLLGKGGMGEVYRADDLTLGQAVALKFLPRDMATNADRLARFHSEVRIARQVAHPNVCRVYDIGDLGGQPFLSMELVDGDDLSSLLRRIGRMPSDKAIDIARQICAGLAAAHNAGVLHRDLKPANIMIDGRGKVRITDFGLAVLADRAVGGDGRAGTPAYMSPEQLDGRELTVQSDIYSLGLVLYETLTGKRPYKARSLAELSSERSQLPDSPSSIIEDIDPALERAILRCLESEPSERPSSAIAVAASLPGGDPLAAALEAGETPSPEMVAAAGEEGRLRPAVAWSIVGALALGLLLMLGVSERYYLINHIPTPKRPAVLEDRAIEIVTRLGYDANPGDRETGYFYNNGYFNHTAENDRSVSRWNVLQNAEPAAMLFWYRQSPEHMQPTERFGLFNVTFGNPENLTPGMVRLTLDPAGNLEFLHAVPPQIDSLTTAAPEGALHLSDAELFEWMGLDLANFEETASVWVPPVYTSERRAWRGHYPGRPDLPLRYEAGFLHGQLVYLKPAANWDEPWKPRSERESTIEKAGGFIGAFLTLALLLASALLARNHVRHGRGDRRGASRLAAFVLSLYLFLWLFTANHTGSLQAEFNQFVWAFAFMLFIGGLFWVLYLALEPYMRREWPGAIVSWTRLLSGRLRDPLVGRDVLIGVALGVAVTLIDVGEHIVPEWFGVAARVPERSATMMLYGAPRAFIVAVLILGNVVFQSLAIAFLLLGLRQLVRKPWVATGILLLIFAFLAGSQTASEQQRISAAVFGLLSVGVLLFALVRFGLVAAIVLAFTSGMLDSSPLTTDFSRWYASSGGAGILLVLAVATYGFVHAVAGRPMQALRGKP